MTSTNSEKLKSRTNKRFTQRKLEISNNRCFLLCYVFFLNLTFTDNWQNLRTYQCSSKAMDGNMSWMYYTEINFSTLKIVCTLWKVFLFFSEDGGEVQKFTD